MKHYVMVSLEDILDEAAENLDHNNGMVEQARIDAYQEGVLDTLVSVLREVCNDDQRSAFQRLIGLAIAGRRG